MDGFINPEDVVIAPHHRAIKPWSLSKVKESMATHQYNPAYPIVLEKNGNEAHPILVDGRHRLESAKALGIANVPYIWKPEDISSIKFGLQCNADGDLTQPDDVFDLAELCYGLSEQEWTGQQIAEELGWSRTVVVQYQNIKAQLHPQAWEIARYGVVAKSSDVATAADGEVATHSVANATPEWAESHLRAFIKELPWHGFDPIAAGNQVAAIKELLTRGEKITAKTVSQVASKWAWFTRLEQYSEDNLDDEVPTEDREALLASIYKDFGSKENTRDWGRFVAYVDSLNSKALEARNFQFHECDIANLPDKLDAESVDFIITDPPYGSDAVGTYSALATLAGKVLKPGGSLLTMAGQTYLPDVLSLLTQESSLKYFWTLSYLTPGGQSPFVANGKVNTFWKPIFWFVKGDYQGKCIGDVIKSDPNDNDKSNHKWGQSESGFADLLKKFVSPGDTVLDPMVGGGTTAAIARHLNCKFIGADIDPEAVVTTKKRLADA